MRKIMAYSLLCLTLVPTQVNAGELALLNAISDTQATDGADTVYYVNNEGVREVYTASAENLCAALAKDLDLPINHIKAILLRMDPVYLYREADVYKELSLTPLTNKPPEKYAQVTEKSVDRGSVYYLPDALYTVSLQLKEKIASIEKAEADNVRLKGIRSEARNKIVFYTAFESLYNKTPASLDSILNTYINLLDAKEAEEYIVIIDNGEYVIDPKFTPLFNNNGIYYTGILAQAMSLDTDLMRQSSSAEIRCTDSPYIYGLNTRENLLLAGCGLIGKVRYVWGGGHGVHNIRGYNPIWFAFNDMYKDHEASCISPGGSWCPIHGNTSNCAFVGSGVRTVSDYRAARSELLSGSQFWQEVMSDMSSVFPNEVISTYPIQLHRVEGLDCSGFCSWLYSQVDADKVYDSSASNFISSGGLTPVPLTDITTGDIMSWRSHVVTILGECKPGVYIVLESADYTVKLGVYYRPSSQATDRDYALSVAKKYNCLIGNISENIGANKICIDSLGARAGRLAKGFADEDVVLPNNKRILDMSAEEILEYIITKLPDTYIWGNLDELEHTADETQKQ